MFSKIHSVAWHSVHSNICMMKHSDKCSVYVWNAQMFTQWCAQFDMLSDVYTVILSDVWWKYNVWWYGII